MNTPILHPLGRIKQKDDRNYQLRDLLAPEDLAPPTTSIFYDNPICLNQGDSSSCTGNAQAHDMSGQPIEIANVNEQVALRIYHQAQLMDGLSLPHVGSSVLAAAKATRKLYRGVMQSFHMAQIVAELRAGLRKFGPFIPGIDWRTGMDTPDADGVCRVTGTIRGGHSFWVCGDDVVNNWAKCLNSWGRVFAKQGFFFIPWEDFGVFEQDGDSDFLFNTGRGVITI